MPIVQLLAHTYFTPFPTKIKGGVSGGMKIFFFTNARFRCWGIVMRCIRRPSGGGIGVAIISYIILSSVVASINYMI